MSRAGAMGLALGACLALAGCTESGETNDPVVATTAPADTNALEGTTPAEDDAPAAPNFTFAVGEAYRDDPSTSPTFVARLEDFFGGALAPLQRLPGLLPRTVSVVYDRCGTANAFNDGATDTITLCHELSEYAYELFSDGMAVEPSNDPEGDLEFLTNQVLSAMAFVLYHEIGHALDGQLELPLAGNVESNVDSIATVIAVETGKPLYAISGAALFYEQPPSLAGVHGGGVDRGGDIACWTVGGDPSARAMLADAQITDIFGIAGRDCVSEYIGQRDTVRGWLPGLARLDAGSPASGATAGTSPFRLTLGPAWLQQADPATRREIEEVFARAIALLDGSAIDLPDPVEVLYETCGEPRSSYDASSRTITLCSELVDHAYRYEVDFIEAETAAEFAFALQHAYDILGFSLYHEVGHVLEAAGRLPDGDSVESMADSVAAVLLVEAGRGLVLLDVALLMFFDQPAAQVEAHGPVGDRSDALLCLMFGGDEAVRAIPQFEDRVENYVNRERDCIAEYAVRRDEVRTWLRGP